MPNENQNNDTSSQKESNAKNTQLNTEPEKEKKESSEVVEYKYETKYKETPYRWFVMVAYFTLTFANGLQWVTFSSCADSFSTNYDMESWKVNMFSLIYMIIYPFVCIPEGWLVDSYSTRLGLIISSACTLAASAFKLLINKSVAWAFVGQFFAGLFQPAILNSPGKIAANWFREDVRTVITTICCLSDTIGILVGFVYHLPFLDTDKTGDDYKKDFFNYMLAEFILCAIFCLPMFFVTKNKPDIPPSPSQQTIQSPPLVPSLKLLFTNKRFIYLLCSTFFVVGYYDVYGTVINSYFALYDISDSECSYIYFTSSIIGLISSLIISKVLDKTKKFKLTMIILGVTGTVFQAIFTLLLELSTKHKSINEFAVGMVMYSLVMAIVIPFYTCGMNYACEITYPVGESINGGIMMSASQISGIAGTFLCDWLINDYPGKTYLTNIIMLLFFVFACVFIFLFDEKLDREEIEKAGREAEKNANKQAEIETQKENNNEEDKEKNEENAQTLQISPVQTERQLVINDNKENEQNNNIATNLLKAN
jgi:FLVCR family feline leukemia virus subgroup C receptor-related protein